MRQILIVCALAVSFTACMIGPNYKRPTADVPKAYRYEPTNARDMADVEWWQLFHDPVLDSLIAEALASNWNVKIAAARVEEAAGILTTTRSPLFPQLFYKARGERFHLSDNESVPLSPGVPNPQKSHQILGAATWEIDLWGRIRRLTESARASMYATEEARRGVILSLVSQVASSYIQLRSLDEQLVVAQRTLETYDQSVKLFELRFKHGQTSQMTVEQARSQYETAAATIPALQNQIAVTENALSILLGRNPGPIERGRALDALATPPIPAGLPSELLARRPDILQAEQNLIAANAQIGAAKALYFPTISLTADYGKSSADLNDLFKGRSRVWSYAGSVTGPIFTGGSIWGQVTQAKAVQQASLFAYLQSIQAGFADVESALISRQKLEEQLGAQQKQVVALREYARLAWLQFDEGYAPYLNVLYAEQQLFPAELSTVQTRADTLIALINIYKAMGGGWVTAADTLTKGAPPQAQTAAHTTGK